MRGVIVLLMLALAGLRYPFPVLSALGYALLVLLWGWLHDNGSGAWLRAMMALAFGLMFFLTLDRTRHVLWAWLSTLIVGLLAWWFWPYLVM